MGDTGGLFMILFSSLLINNVIMSQFLGICPFLGVSKKVSTATGMGIAVIFVISLSSVITWLANRFILVPLEIEYLRTLAFILIIAALVQLVETVIKKSAPSLYQALGVYLPLITTNCAVLGIALLNIEAEYNLMESLVNGIGSSAGFALAIILFAGIRERLELSDIPEPLQGFPIAMISAGLMSVAFMAFQ